MWRERVLDMAEMAVALVTLASLFTVGMAVIVWLLLLYDKLFPVEEKRSELPDERAVKARI